jgi:peptidoglycan/LPS O-acetylase OafA/YrhL
VSIQSPVHAAADTSRRSIASRFIARFQRVTSSGKFISEIDGLRFIAIGTVVLFHCAAGLAVKSPAVFTDPGGSGLVGAVARYGYHGVELFFIISGFILAYPFALHHLRGKEPVRLKSYFLRRVTRLEPPYVLCMIILFCAQVMRGRDADALFPHLAASLVYLHNIVFGTESAINNVAWSLEIEIQFYLLVPVLSMLFMIRRTAVRRLVIAAVGVPSLVLAGMLDPATSRLALTIVRYLHFFLIGFLLADIFIVTWKEHPAKTRLWDIVSLIGWPLLFVVWNRSREVMPLLANGRDTVLSLIFFPAAALLLYIAVFRGTLTNRIITNRWITAVGGMCYTIYLFHNPVMGWVLSATMHVVPTAEYSLNLLTQLLLVTPPLLVMTGIYFLAVEKPCMKKEWYKDTFRRFRQLTAATVSE